MTYYKDNTLFKRKDDRLHIYKRKDKKSENWYARTFIDKKQIQISSKTSNKKQAIKILEKWFERLHFRLAEGLQVHQSTFEDCLSIFLNELKDDISRSKTSNKSIKSRMNVIMKCKPLMKSKIDEISYEHLKKFLIWRNEESNKLGKQLSGKTLRGDLVTISSFLSWSAEKGYRKEKLQKITTKLLEKKLRNERTQRVHFMRQEYQHLLKTSRNRIAKARGTRVRFERNLLHQFIIFMAGSGLRVNECLNLKFEDVRLIDKHQAKPNLKKSFSDNFYNRLERYYTINNAFGKKQRANSNIGMGSCYFAVEEIMKLYQKNNIKISPSTKIFKNKSFREGLNSLLFDADLKTKKIGNEFVKRDSKSFRHTYILFQIQNGVSATDIAKNLDTSTEMIDKFYTANVQTDELIDRLTKINRLQIKAVS